MASSPSCSKGAGTRGAQAGWLRATLSFLLITSVQLPASTQQLHLAQNYTTGAVVHANSLQSKPNYLETGRQITGILDRFMSLGYDKRVRPNYGGPPVEVNVTMRILSISSVSEVMMDFTADFYFRQTWHDPRLSFKKLGDIQTLYVGAEVSKKIWLPDTFFGNEKMAYFHEATTPNVFLRIDHSGEVYRSIRLTVTSSCPMNLQYFPMDRQRCTIEAESYGYNVKDIIYRWARKDTAVERDKEISLPQFDIVQTVQKYRLEELSSGTYSRLIAEIHFARRMGYYLIQIYIPSSLIVVISWVSFWLHRNASPARVQLGVTTVLTMTTLMSSTNAALPKISYVKSIDIFLGTCFVMVFAALLEYATVGYLGKRIAMRKAHAQHAQSQAQARLFAHLQSQGAQGEPLSQLTTLAAPGSSPGDHAAAAMAAAASPNISGAPEFPVELRGTAPGQPCNSPLAALLRDHNLLMGAPTGGQQAHYHAPALPPANNQGQLHAASCQQHSTSARPGTREGSSACRHHGQTKAQGCSHHQSHAHTNQQACGHHHACRQQAHEDASPPPPAPPRKFMGKPAGTNGCSTCHRLGSQTLPRNLPFTQEQPQLHSISHQAACCNTHAPQAPSQPANLLSPQLMASTPVLSPSKGASAAAAQAAATFVNLHRKNKGLPPSTNPNFAQFNSIINPPYNRQLEAIFGIRPSDIDKYSRVVFPVCFVCFQLMYWIVYLHISAFLEPDQHSQQSPPPLPTQPGLVNPVSPLPT